MICTVGRAEHKIGVRLAPEFSDSASCFEVSLVWGAHPSNWLTLKGIRMVTPGTVRGADAPAACRGWGGGKGRRGQELVQNARHRISLSVNVLSQGKPARKPGTQRHEAKARRFAPCSSACQYTRVARAPSPRCVDTPHRWMMGERGWDPPPDTISSATRFLVTPRHRQARRPCRIRPDGVDCLGKNPHTRRLPRARSAAFRGIP